MFFVSGPLLCQHSEALNEARASSAVYILLAMALRVRRMESICQSSVPEGSQAREDGIMRTAMVFVGHARCGRRRARVGGGGRETTLWGTSPFWSIW